MSDVTSLKDTIIPKSDQLNADQLLSAPMAITVTEVRRGSGQDQPVIVHYENDGGRPFKPCKTMRKVLIFAWGDDGRKWVGRSMVLFCDPDVKFGGVKVGGIRISHLSDIERDLGLSLNTTKGKKGEFIIKKLPVIRPLAELRRVLSAAADGGTKDLRGMWQKLNEFERLMFDAGTCPEEYKKIAADVDAGIPRNIDNQENKETA
jgi:hypothetical protein